MQIDTKLIMQLRSQTGAGMKVCQEALAEANGDLAKAVDVLRKKGAKIAGKRADKEAKEGIIFAYIHANNKIGVLLELNCETDFVAKTDGFKQLAHDLAMQIAAQSPLYIAAENVPEEVINKEKDIYKEQLLSEGKPEKMMDKIIEGKINKWLEDVCLLKQQFIKNEDITIEEYINEKIASMGEKIKVGSFCRKQI
ncbi:MAG: translation elongation factor Ts [Candidatus Parcubacteria bacterium]|nr:translation elongation factor Ts [Candidatus Parcubacteria bacterium]